MASTLRAIARHDPNSIAILHSVSGRHFTYGELYTDILQERDSLRSLAGSDGLAGQRVAFLIENSYDYVGAT